MPRINAIQGLPQNVTGHEAHNALRHVRSILITLFSNLYHLFNVVDRAVDISISIVITAVLLIKCK